MDDYSIADIAAFPWVRAHAWAGISIDGLLHLRRGLATIESRPAVGQGLKPPEPLDTIARLDQAGEMTTT